MLDSTSLLTVLNLSISLSIAGSILEERQVYAPVSLIGTFYGPSCKVNLINLPVSGST